MTGDQYPYERAAVQLLELFRGAGMSRGSILAFRLVHGVWRLTGSSEGQARWQRLVHSAEHDMVAVLEAVSFDLREGRERLSALSGHSMRSALLLVDQFWRALGRDGLRDLAEGLLAVQSESGEAMGEHATPRWLAELMAGLVGPSASALDPAAGTGNGLLALAERGARVSGFDVNEDAVSVARARLEMAEAPACVERGDSLQSAADFGQEWDAVVITPPLGLILTDYQREGLVHADVPQVLLRGRRGMYWIHLAAQLLHPGGRAAVLLTEGSTFAGAELEHLLREGILEGVISLPPNFLSNTAIAGALWLVRPPGEATGRFLTADATSLAQASGRRRLNVLAPDATESLVKLVRTFRTGAEVDAPAHVAKSLDIAEISLDRGLTPTLFLGEAPSHAEVLPEPSGHLLTGLEIEGYKSFRDRIQLPLAPLTVVYGPNSAGKSSLIQSLLLLKQSLEHPYLVTQGTVADVGGFTGIRNRHVAPTVRFAVEFGAPVWDLPRGGTPDPTCPRRLEFSFEDGGAGRGSLQSWRVNAGPLDSVWTREQGSMSTPSSSLEPIFGELGTGTFLFPFDTRQQHSGVDEATLRVRSERNRKRAEGYAKKLVRNGIDRLTIDWDGLLPSGKAPALPRHATQRDESVAQSYVDRTALLVAGPGHELRSILASLIYLGPLRSAPQRFYSRTSSAGLPGDGRDAVLYLYDHGGTVEQVNEWFSTLDIPYELGIIPISASENPGLVGDLVAVSLKDLRSGVTVTPADVGYGISQCMPLVVELTARSRSVICIEQPETHLHPRLQARLADLLIDATRVEDRANQVVVETHSEHLMLRLQRRIREGDLDPQDLCVLYVDQDEAGAARVHRLRLDDGGDFIDEWPDGFFDERMIELFGGMA